MAGFGDSNDIKIAVSLDTKDAVDGVKKLTDEINLFLKRVDAPFKKLGELSKEVTKAQIADIQAKRDVELQTIKSLDTANQQKHDRILERIRAEVASEKIASNEFLQLEKSRVNESIKLNQQKQVTARKIIDDTTKFNIAKVAAQLESEKSANIKSAKDFAEKEKSNRTEALKTIALINQETAKIKKTRIGDLGSTIGSGKAIDSLKNAFLGASVGIGRFNVGIGTLASTLGPTGLLVGGAGLATGAIIALGNAASNSLGRLADGANKVQGLSTAFSTLQQSLARDPSASIERLRTATQGLISDTELYQKANQAVLLGVPAKLFDESAEAAVKLGRAMGIDARLALESLSIGLGRQSRLYLDNLGIIVSATEAYRKYAQELKKSVNDLSDAEKRQAFFNETSTQLREGLARLPEIQDDVGIAYSKLNTLTQNASDAFLRSFNSSKELEGGIRSLREGLAVSLIPALERLGNVAGSIFAKLLDVASSTLPPVIGFIKELAENLDIVFFKSSATRAEQLQLEVTNLTKQLQQAEKSYEELQSRPSRLTEQQGQLVASLRERLNQVTQELNKTLQDQFAAKNKSVNIPLRIGNDQVLSDIAETESLLSGLKQKTEEDLGVIRLPGIDLSVVKQFEPELDGIFQAIESGKLTAEAAGIAIGDTVKKIGEAINEANKKVTELDIERVKKALATKPDNADLKLELATLEQRKKLLEEGIQLDEAQRRQVIKVVQAREKAAKKREQDAKTAAKEGKKLLDQQKRQIDDFVKSVRRNTKTAIDPKFERQLAELFRGVDADSQEFEDGLRDIAKAALDANTDLSVLSKTIKAQQKLLEQGVPKNQLPLSADAAEDAVAYNEELKKAQEGMFNLRELFKGPAGFVDGKQEGGGFFGFDLGTMDSGTEAQLAQQVQDSLASVFQAGADGFTREDVPAISAAVGAAAGAGIAAAFSLDPATGAQIGSAIGGILGNVFSQFGKDLPGTAERKAIDKYFGDLFDKGRLTVVLQNQLTGAIDESTGEAIRIAQAQLNRISDLVFEGFTPFAGELDFGGENFFNYFNTLSAEIQNSFNGVGVAIGMLQGLSTEQARLIGTALANNIGGNLQNLQVLVQQTGESFEDLSQTILKAFRDAQLTAEEAYNALVQLQNIYSEGIPGAIGDFRQAIENLNTALENDQPGQYALDSLRDIGAEGEEARASFETVVSSLGQTFGFAADQQARLFEALRLSGITSLQQLAQASDEQLLTLIRNINAIRENAEAPLAAVPVIPTAARTGGGGSKRDPAKDLLEKQKEEARKLTQESLRYLQIIKEINAEQLTTLAGGKEIAKINADILKTIKERDRIEKALNTELDKGAKGNKRRIGELSRALDELNKKLEAVRDSAKANERQYKQLDIAGIIPLIKSQNSLGLVAEQIGVSLQKNVDILVKGFLQGRLSIQEVNDEIKKTKDLLGPGIPGAVGAVTDAFQNLIDAGTQGGAFSVDAFTDIFAEFREKFNKEGSAFREAQRKQLVENLDIARQASLTAVGPEASEAARKALEVAKKALEDFRNVPLVPDLSDLREQLKGAFSPEQVDLFFQALDESGLKSFDQLEGASSEAIIGILGRLQELGFKFGETSEEAAGINKGLQDAETAANAGLDPLKEAIDLVKQFNEGATGLPPVFNSTTQAIGELNGPLSELAAGFDNIIEKLGLLSGNTFENEVVFNIRTTGEEGGKALIDLIFGDGSNASTGTGNGSTGGGGGAGGTGGRGGGGSKSGSKGDWIRLSPGVWRNKKTKRLVKSKDNPGA